MDEIDLSEFAEFFRYIDMWSKDVVASRMTRDASDCLTDSDKDMFERALEGYERTERELSLVRRMIREKTELPDEYVEKRRKRTVVRKDKAKEFTDSSVQSFADIIGNAFGSL